MKNKIYYLTIIAIAMFMGYCSLPGDQPKPNPPDTTLKSPVVSVTEGEYTQNRQPTWTWTVPEYAQALRYRLNGANSWTIIEKDENNTFKTSYAPESDLIDGLYSLEVQARDVNNTWSSSGFASIIIDNLAPEPPKVIGPAKTNKTFPTWNWTFAVDKSLTSVQYRLYRDTQANIIIDWTASTELITSLTSPVSLSDKSKYTLEVIAGDWSGNWSNPGFYTIEIDSSYFTPYVSGVSPTNDTTPVWTWDSPDGVQAFRYRIDIGAWVEVSKSVTSFTPASPLIEGEHTLEVQAKDIDGIWSDSGSRTISIDVTPPSPPSVSGTERMNNQRPTWTWGNLPGDAVDIRYRLDNAAWIYVGGMTTTSYTPASIVSEGNHTLDVQVRDSAGNWSESGKWVISVDITAPGVPTVTGVSPTNDTTPTWSWTIPLDTTDFRCRLDSGTWIEINGTGTTEFTPASPLSSGNHVLEVQARDDVGNWSLSVSFSVFIDLSAPNAPIVTGVTPTNNQRPVWNWTIPGGAVDIRYRFNSSEWTHAGGTSLHTYQPLSDLPEGSYQLDVQACNTLGNWSVSGSRTIQIDITPPDSPVLSGVASTSDTTPTWNWSIPSDSVNTRYNLDAGNWVITGNITVRSFTPGSPLSNGNHTLNVQVQDAAGNWSSSGTFTTSIDSGILPAPIVSVAQLTNNRTPGWTWTNPPGTANIRYRLDGAVWTVTGGASTTSFIPAASLSEGAHTLDVQVQNSVGSWSDSGSATTTIDITPPDIPAVTGDTPTMDPTPLWNWTIPIGCVEFQFCLDAGEWSIVSSSITSFTPASPLSQGSHALAVKARDAAGNWSSAGTKTIIIDANLLEPPVVSGISPTTDRTPTWTWNVQSGTTNFRYMLDSGPWTVLTGIGTTSFTPASSLSYGNHTLFVQAQNNMNTWSESGSHTIAVMVPTPENISATRGTYNDRIVISWNQVSDAAGYTIFRSTSESGPYSELVTTTSLTYPDQTATSGPIYYYEIRAFVSAELYSDKSSPVSGYTSVYIPINISASQGTYMDRITIAFTNVSNLTFHVERSAFEAGPFAEIGTCSGSPYNDSTVLDNAVYYYRVRAVTTAGAEGAYSATVSGYRNTLPTPTNLFATDGEYSDKVVLYWDIVAGAELYYVYRSTEQNGTFQEIGINPVTLPNPTTFEDGSAVSNTLYFYKIRAWSSVKGFSNYGNTDQGSLLEFVPLPPIAVNASDGMYAGRIDINWQASEGAEEYIVYKSGTENGTYSELVVTSSTSYSDHAVVAGVTYYYYVKARAAAGGTSFQSVTNSGFAN